MTDALSRLKAALADRYAIERELGRGGMAVVYLAEDLRHERRVAIKVLCLELTSVVAAERFLNEIKVTAGLAHPHILPLLDSGEADGLLYYVMPYVEGESLREKLNRQKQLPIDEAIRIAREVADALSYAHGRNLLHRDIKPENILLVAGHAVVADFGIAKVLSEATSQRLTDTGISVGTPAYMSPEQAAGEKEVGESSDLYALACVLYEMLAGDPPFTGRTPQAVLAKHMADTPMPIQAVRSSVSERTAHAIEIALAKAPVDRFATASDFADALEPLTLENLRTALAPAYEVERELCTGGMGSVFLARDPNLDRDVAIKVLRPDIPSEVAPERFQREARVLARLKHPSIVPVYQAGEADGFSYYVMEYIEGETLAERLKRALLSGDEALTLGNDLLSALDTAHQEGIIHRDVKPDNIFLVGDRSVLVDFGIAKRVEESGELLTADDRRVGTPAYMAPEQFTGDVVTPLTDVYAVGMCLYEALTGRRWSIFTATDEGDWSGVPKDLIPPIRRALAWLPSERWDDAVAFRAALKGEHPQSLVERYRRSPPQSLSLRVPGTSWLGRLVSMLPYPVRRAAWVGFVYSVIGYVLVEITNMLVLTGSAPPFVNNAAITVFLVALPVTLFLSYRHARNSENRSPR